MGAVMSQFSILRTTIGSTDISSSRIVQLAFVHDVLFSSTLYDGQITSWSLDTLEEGDINSYLGSAVAGSMPVLADVGASLLTGGGSGNSLVLHSINPDGSLGTSQNLGFGSNFGAVTTLEDGGSTVVFAGRDGGGRLTHFTVSSSGNISTPLEVVPNAPVDVLTTANVGGTPFLFTAATATNEVTVWNVDANDAPSEWVTVGADQGLWASQPTALATAPTGGETYLILAAAGSSSLTTFKIAANGNLEITDHLMDDLGTRFAGVSALTAIEHEGESYIIAGGRDDGVSLLQLLPTGRLLHLGLIADNSDAALSNPSGLAAKSSAGSISIYVASSTDVGLTELVFNTSNTGSTVMGTNASETINGTSQDDILIDLGGSDTLIGGAGADVFMFEQDDTLDTVADFELGQDTIDLSAWAGLRSSSQLFLTSTSTGLTITYGDEVIDVQTSNGAPLSETEFVALGLQISTRLSTTPQQGLSGPLTADPDLPDRDPYVPPTQDLSTEVEGIERVGVASAEALTGTQFDDQIWGQGGDDSIYGNAGNDMLFGGTGADLIDGQSGADVVSGGSGRSTLWSFGTDEVSSADTLLGGDGDDVLMGYAGADTLNGEAGDDILTGGGGRDTFIFTGGNDRITDFQLGVDRLLISSELVPSNTAPSALVATYGFSSGGQVALGFGSVEVILEGLENTTDLSNYVELF